MTADAAIAHIIPVTLSVLCGTIRLHASGIAGVTAQRRVTITREEEPR
jgi:hypothetical protein